MFGFSIRSEVTRKYYERVIRNFFDFIEFAPNGDIERRCKIPSELTVNKAEGLISKLD